MVGDFGVWILEELAGDLSGAFLLEMVPGSMRGKRQRQNPQLKTGRLPEKALPL